MKLYAAVRRRCGVVCAAMVPGLIALSFSETVYGSGLHQRFLARSAAVGSLTLYAALTLGIGVAVLAVIAFLHMTRGRNTPAMADGQKARRAESSVHAHAARQPAISAVREDDGEPAEMLPEYTIPLPGITNESSLSDAVWRGKPRIYGLGGKFAGESFRITDEAGEISRRHCSIRYDADSGTFYLEDHGSSNGTFLPGGEKLIPGKSYPLKAGDRFALSGDSHWFEIRN
jgi:hypothetical protein